MEMTFYFSLYFFCCFEWKEHLVLNITVLLHVAWPTSVHGPLNHWKKSLWPFKICIWVPLSYNISHNDDRAGAHWQSHVVTERFFRFKGSLHIFVILNFSKLSRTWINKNTSWYVSLIKGREHVELNLILMLLNVILYADNKRVTNTIEKHLHLVSSYFTRVNIISHRWFHHI